MLVAVTAYTPDYAFWLPDLEKSCREVGLELIKEEFPPARSWKEGTHIKPKVILKTLQSRQECNVVWLDVNCRVRRYPVLLECIPSSASIGAFSYGGYLWGGTLWVRNSLEGRELMEMWDRSCAGNPEKSSDAVLWAILKEGHHPAYARLPYSYLSCATENKWKLPVLEYAAIVHYDSGKK